MTKNRSKASEENRQCEEEEGGRVQLEADHLNVVIIVIIIIIDVIIIRLITSWS